MMHCLEQSRQKRCRGCRPSLWCTSDSVGAVTHDYWLFAFWRLIRVTGKYNQVHSVSRFVLLIFRVSTCVTNDSSDLGIRLACVWYVICMKCDVFRQGKHSNSGSHGDAFIQLNRWIAFSPFVYSFILRKQRNLLTRHVSKPILPPSSSTALGSVKLYFPD